jgi:predicted nucleic acid-binding protein
MTLIDTGYFIALFSPTDSLHSRAVAWSSALRGPLLVTEYVLVETMNYFSRPPDRARAASVMQWVVSGACSFVAASPNLLEAGWKLFEQRTDKGWSLTDCISFEVMRTRGLTDALAYDEHFEQAGFRALLRSAPPDRV